MGKMNGTTKVTKGWDLFKLTFVLFVAFVVEKHFSNAGSVAQNFCPTGDLTWSPRPRNRLFKLNQERKF
jgi:hypothetical protein